MSSWLYLLLILNQDYRDICGMHLKLIGKLILIAEILDL